MPELLALLAGVGWGTTDHLGGRRTRDVGVVRTLLVSQLASAVLLAAIVVFTPPPDWSRLVLPGVLAGMSEGVGVAAVYRGLAGGPAALVAPAAATAPVVPVVAGVVTGVALGAGPLVGVLLVLVGLVAVAGQAPAGTRSRAGELTGLGHGLLSALGFGGYFVFMAEASRAGVPWALLTARTTTLALVALAAVIGVAVRGRRESLSARTVGALAAIGLLVAAADASYAFATTRGTLVLVAVLGATHPVVTIAWARLRDGERIGRLRAVAIATTLVGVAVLTATST